MRKFGVVITLLFFIVLAGAILAFLIPPKVEVVSVAEGLNPAPVSDVLNAAVNDLSPKQSEVRESSSAEGGQPVSSIIPPATTPEQKPIETKDNPALPLKTPPEVVKAVYATGWSAGSRTRLDYLKRLIKDTEANAIVIDLKDYAGAISYRTGDPRISMYGGEETRIRDIRKLVEELHAEDVYVIGRITVFQDPVLAAKRPDIAVKDDEGNLWSDNKKLYWVDPSAKDVWDYNINLARNAFGAGFDEINFDYIRFPSDGNLAKIAYPASDLSVKTKSEIIKSFFRYLREALPGKVISADLFGLVTVNKDDLGIGQLLENTFPYFDYIAPMTYPSHYAAGFIGYASPAEYPYEVVKYSMDSAEARLRVARSANPDIKAKFRPWIQDFDLGAVYNAAEVKAQIRAAEEAGSVGWMIWSPQNVYTKEAILNAQ